MTDSHTPIPDSHTPTESDIRGGTGYQFGEFTMLAPAGTTFDDLRHPSCYRHIAARLSPGCIIKV